MTSSEKIIQRARESGNPIIQGNRAIFFWEGDSAPELISDVNGWEAEHKPKPFKRAARSRKSDPEKRAWSVSLTVPRDAYVEYAFYDPISQERFLDPLNRHTVNNGVGSRNNFFYMPEAAPTPFSIRRTDVPTGTLTHHRVQADYWQEEMKRDVYLYEPPVKEAVPLLIVYDGYDYLHRGKLTTIVDNLIAEKRIRPIAMALLQNGKSRRAVEYFCSDATIHWLDYAVLRLARKQLKLINLEKHPGSFGVLGASAGGLMSMYTGMRMPDIFGKVLCQAAVFSLDGRDFVVKDLVRYGQGRDLQIWMDVGTLDELLEDNRRMIALLDRRQYNVAYREFSGGHNYTAWRDDLPRGLETLFGS